MAYARAFACGAVATLAAAALLLRPDPDLLDSGKGPLGRWGIVVIALCVAWAVGVMFATERLRPRIRGGSAPLPPREDRLRRTLMPLLLAGPAALGVLALVLHHFTPHQPTVAPLPAAPPTPSQPPRLGKGAPANPDGFSLSPYVLLIIPAVIALVLLVLLVRRLLRRGGFALPPPAPPAVPAADEERELLFSAVRSGRRALADGVDARAAVIACYAAMEEALAVSGVGRRASDSPADLLTRASRAGFAQGPAAPRLTALFREARYSTHPMDDAQRTAAAEALEEIAARLQEREASA
ncbi:DUF4129 domain-containing protein [Streptomyces sp. NPDC052225]|uniref:DUF4129 domain-containing protein n=1 Tax=Streptomyces sp. NPDC052225 TaxID=3154949 RepID=UPI003422C650